MNSDHREPVPGRPRTPDGYGVPETIEGTVPWDHVRARMTNAKIYWLGTTRPDGRSHNVPIWAAWLDDTLYFDAPPGTRRQRNLAVNPAVSVHLESGEDVVILEGTAAPLTDLAPAVFTRLADAYAAKYPYRPPGVEGMYRLQLRTAFAWTMFPQDATRWQFPGMTR